MRDNCARIILVLYFGDWQKSSLLEVPKLALKDFGPFKLELVDNGLA